jgi:hypothetical protein
MSDDASPACDRCGRSIHPGRGDYYLVRIDAVADPAPPVLTAEDLACDVGAEMERLLERMRGMTEQELEEQVARRLIVRLCVPCYRGWIANPLG